MHPNTEWISTRPNGLPFILNKVCDNCVNVAPIAIRHGKKKWLCGQCWNEKVEFRETISI